jgi:glycosyltransferase involved in cell wall biosynthesis
MGPHEARESLGWSRADYAAVALVRVLVWSDLFWPYIGGPEVLAAALLPKLRERGHEFLVLTSHDYLELPDEATHRGIPIERLPLRAALDQRDLAGLRAAREAVAERKRAFAPDLVHAIGVGPSLFFHLRTAEAHPAPWVIWLQSEVLASQSEGQDTLLLEVMRSADWVAACSETVLAQGRRVMPEIAARSSVIRNAVAAAPEPPEELPRVPRLLCLGRLMPAKGFDVALTAFATLAPRFPSLRLTIAGDGAARGELERQAASLEIDDHVDFLGWVDPDRISALIDEATVVVMPSRREGLPVAAAQAASRARPIVASRVGGLPEVVVHGQSGMLVEPEDARGLAQAVAYMLDHPGDAARMGRAAHASVREALSLDRCVDAFDDLYRTLTRRYQWSA